MYYYTDVYLGTFACELNNNYTSSTDISSITEWVSVCITKNDYWMELDAVQCVTLSWPEYMEDDDDDDFSRLRAWPIFEW